jgi:hypothetical protein
MKARSSIIRHPEGFNIETPLLIPSFSSKGFAIEEENGLSEVARVIRFSREYITDIMLISAYDLFYNHIQSPENFVSSKVVLIDSGGYEVSELCEFSGMNKTQHIKKNWEKDNLIEVIKKWPSRFPCIIVNYDNVTKHNFIEKQISDAKEFFNLFPDKLSDFLVKPEGMNKEIPSDKQKVLIQGLKYFDIIGFTEKELGNSIFKRMKYIHEFRTEMDMVGINKPIHIFGSLDPIHTLLYFLAGAEIFDGLTWLRFSFYNGLSIYPFDYGVISEHLGLKKMENDIKTESYRQNIYYLEKMKYAMKEFIIGNDFTAFNVLGGIKFGNLIKDNYHYFINNINS